MKNITYSHEHIVIDLSKGKNDNDCYLNLYEDALDELKVLKDKGVTRIVDCSNRGIGQDWEINKKVEREIGIEIINSTGFYKDPFLPDYISSKSINELALILLDDLNNGAQIIGEIGTSLNEITKNEIKVFEAACVAQKQKNCVIITHTTLGTMALEQVKFFQDRSINLNKVIISHVALSKDFEMIAQLLNSGVNIAFDTIGKEKYCDDKTQAEYIAKLVQLGYKKQILMSMDCTRKSHLKKNGGHGFSYLVDEFVPLLQSVGVNEKDIEEIMCVNFTRILEA